MRKLAKPMLLLTAIIWGSSFMVMKNTLDVLPPYSLLAMRFTISVVLLALVFWKKWKLLTWEYLWQSAIVGGFLFLAYVIQTIGLQYTTPSKNAFLTAVYCVLVPFFNWAVMKHRPDRYNLAAAFLCVAGIGFVSLDGAMTIQKGDFLTLCCAAFYAAHIVAVEKTSGGKDIYLLTVLQFAFAASYAWTAVALCEQFPTHLLARPDFYPPILYLGVMATAVGLLFQNVGQVWSDPASTAVILSLESVFGVLFSVLFYGDPVTLKLLLGFGLIFVAVVCSETKLSFLKKQSKC